MKLIEVLAAAHQAHEGWYKGSKSYRNNNPGNIRKNGVFITFPTYIEGFLALQYDLRAKITNNSKVMTDYYKQRGITYDQGTIQDYINVYAPADDGNSPELYAQDICNRSNALGWHITPSTLLSVLAPMLNQGPPLPDEPVIVHVPIAPEIQAKNIERRITNEQNPVLKFSLQRALERIKTYFHLT